MQEQQYEAFKAEKARLAPISIDDLTDKTPRTLLFGYNTDRATFHVYIDPVDKQIHVLTYVTPGTRDSERVLVLVHASGPAGGLERNEDYVPDKRLYPESCDLEFCRLLRDAGICLPFTTFGTQGPDRLERFNGFAGYRFTPELPVVEALRTHFAVNMQEHLPFNPAEFKEQAIVAHLVRSACVETGAVFAIVGYPGETMVSVSDVDKVKAKLAEYYATMSPATTRDVDEIETDISSQAVKWAGYANAHNHYVWRTGSYAIDIRYDNDAEFEQVPGAVMYESAQGYPVLQGTYEGRPYFIVLRNENDSSEILVSLFGSAEQFVAQTMEFYQLTPQPVTN